MNDFESNFQAIKRSYAICQKRKKMLLQTQIQAIEIRLLDDVATLTPSERTALTTLHHEIERYKKTF